MASSIDIASLAQALGLIMVANSAPLLMKRLLGARAAFPLDFNAALADGRPVLGKSKTFRGLAAAVVSASIAAPLIGLPMSAGALVAVGSMGGDMFSSFLKRRLGLPPSSRAPGLDQIPEGLFGLLAGKAFLPLTNTEVFIGVSTFWIGQVVLARLSHAIGLRDEDY